MKETIQAFLCGQEYKNGGRKLAEEIRQSGLLGSSLSSMLVSFKNLVDLTELKHYNGLRRRRACQLLFALDPVPPCENNVESKLLVAVIENLLDCIDDWHLIASGLLVMLELLIRSLHDFDRSITVTTPRHISNTALECTPFRLRHNSESQHVGDSSPPSSPQLILPQYREKCSPYVALVGGIIVFVDTPVYADDQRKEILSVLSQALRKSADQCIDQIGFTNLIKELLEQVKTEQTGKCIDLMCQCLVSLSNYGAYSGTEGSLTYPKLPSLPNDPRLGSLWQYETINPTLLHLEAEEELKQFFYESFSHTSEAYYEALCKCWPRSMLPLLWDFWLDHSVLLLEEKNNEENLASMAKHLLLTVLHSDIDILQYLFTPLIELFKLTMWSDTAPQATKRFASSMILGTSVKFLSQARPSHFQQCWNSVWSIIELLKRASPLKSGPDFESSEFVCFRVICDAISLSGVRGSMIVLIHCLPVLLNFIHADVMENSHLYNAAGYVGRNVLSQLQWLSSLLDRFLKFYHNFSAAKAGSLLDDAKQQDEKKLIMSIWSTQVQPVCDASRDLLEKTLGALPKTDSGSQAWWQVQEQVARVTRDLLGGDLEREEVISTTEPKEEGSIDDHTKWRVKVALELQGVYRLNSQELIQHIIYQVQCHQKQTESREEKDIVEEALEVWKRTKDMCILDALVKHNPDFVREECDELTASLPLALLEQIVCKEPAKYLTAAYQAAFVSLNIWANLLKALNQCSFALPWPVDDLGRFKYLILHLKHGPLTPHITNDIEFDRALYAWKYSRMVLDLPVLGCPVDVDLETAKWLCQHKGLVQNIEVQQTSQHWVMYEKRRLAILRPQDVPAATGDECADLIVAAETGHIDELACRTRSRLGRGMAGLFFVDRKF